MLEILFVILDIGLTISTAKDIQKCKREHPDEPLHIMSLEEAIPIFIGLGVLTLMIYLTYWYISR